MATDFGAVIAADHVRAGLIGQASLDGLLAPGADQGVERHCRRSRGKQEALALLVLFDKVMYIDSSDKHPLCVPELEELGAVERIHLSFPFRLATGDVPRPADERLHPALPMLERVNDLRPLVVDALMKRPGDNVIKELVEELKAPRREVYNLMIDLALNYFSRASGLPADRAPLGEVASDVADALFGAVRKAPSVTAFGIIGAAAAHADDVACLTYLSAERGVPVATRTFANAAVGWHRRIGTDVSPSDMAKGFGILRCALHDEGQFFPRITGIRQALHLRKDPKLADFRASLRQLLRTVALGDANAVRRARSEVRRAQQSLVTADATRRLLRWVTYLSLPLGLIEAVTTGTPVAGLTLSAFSAAALAGSDASTRRSQWVLFGR